MSFDDSDSDMGSEGEDSEMIEADEPIGPRLEDFYNVGKEIGKYVFYDS